MEWCHDGLSIFLVLSQAGLLKNSAQGPVMVLGRVFLCEKGASCAEFLWLIVVQVAVIPSETKRPDKQKTTWKFIAG